MTRTALSLADIIRGRRSVRRYTTQSVPEQVISAMLEAACWAPSPHGSQPWRFVVLQNYAPKQRLALQMAERWQQQLARDGEDAATIERRLRISQLRIAEAPVLILACLYLAELPTHDDELQTNAEYLMATQSLGCAIQNLLLNAYAQGVDTGWMCAPLFCGDVVQRTLGLEATFLPHALITVGYALADPVRRPRRPLTELVQYIDE